MLVKLHLWFSLAAAAVAAPSKDTYDYIVVGGGTAGVAVAARLSEGLPYANILLIEAGPAVDDEPKINIPGMKGSTLGTKYDWNFTTVPQAGANNRVWPINRGKVLGGSSALNLMTYDRAAVAEYDAWEALGNPGWNWKTMIRAMMKSETFTGKNTATYGSKGVGDSGPVKAVVNRIIPKHQESWIPTLNKLGVRKNLESLGGNPLGVMYQPSSIDPSNYNRSYSANAYTEISGSNLEILADTTVAKINVSGPAAKKKAIATGVTLQDGTYVKARREVILSAGSIQSPGLLEQSGIGSKPVLSAAGIKQIVDLPGVGENLQDHLRVMTSYQLKPQFLSFDALRSNATFAAEQLALWNAGKRSLKVDKKKLDFLKDSSVPQVEVIFSDGYTGVKGYPAATSPLFGKGFVTLIGVVMHPLSRGSVHINPSDPAGKPTINPNYLSNSHDVEAVLQTVKYNRKIANTEPMRSIWEDEYEPGLDVKTDAQIKDYVLRTTLSIFHPSGTCAMLPKADGGVVDAKLKVYGIENLRVVDASVIPLLISAHIQTAVYGIAEIAAELIIKDAK
ncbi:Uncharacterized protein Y057_10815 [Fusarium fujikuroi]|nr:Uncharacterized protein Y057_10815 [Fusarium fujikuroi]